MRLYCSKQLDTTFHKFREKPLHVTFKFLISKHHRFLARDVIYTSRAYATMSVSVCLYVCLSVTEVHWRIIANLGFKFRSTFTAHCGRGVSREEEMDHRREEWKNHLALC